MANGRKSSGLWIAVLGIAAVAAASAYFFLGRDGGTPPATPGATAPAAATADKAAPAPAAATGGEAAQRTDLTIGDLLRNAGTAVSDRRLIDPPGNSAVDYYLLVLGREPNNAAAQEGLREMFSLATGEIEQKINAGDLDDSRRAIDLLGKFDASNYTLTILRNKLDLKKKQMDREQEKRDQDKALALNAAKNATAPTAAPTTAPAADAAKAAAPTAETAAAKPAPVAVTTPAKPAAEAAASKGETRAAIPVSQPPPNSPADAFRSRQEGWVEVTFTVGTDGSVKDGSVVGANPARIFNSAALRGIANWKFQPRLDNGQPVEQQVRTRIEFKLPGK